jgi:hypothetical protein
MVNCFLSSYDGGLPTAYCLLCSRGVPVGGTLGQHRNLRQDVTLVGKEETLAVSKMKERSGNVIENKGSGSEAAERSFNVVDSKGDMS